MVRVSDVSLEDVYSLVVSTPSYYNCMVNAKFQLSPKKLAFQDLPGL